MVLKYHYEFKKKFNIHDIISKTSKYFENINKISMVNSRSITDISWVNFYSTLIISFQGDHKDSLL